MLPPWLPLLFLMAASPDPPPALTITKTEAAPVLDGNVVSDPFWQQVAPATTFWQTSPDDGQPASERTEVRVVATDEALYFAVVCLDREPDRMVVTASRRDSSLADTDSFSLVLDTFRDGQNGFVFGTNPAGLEYDAQLSNEGGSAGLGGFNLNWDGAWRVRTASGEFGWSAEFEIPFRTLRYSGAAEQAWGLNMQRNIRRRNERAYWSPLSREHGIERLSSAGALLGVRPPPRRVRQLTPYALAQRAEQAAAASSGQAEMGGELKLGLTPSLTLDLTVNTDFAQVEVDEQQINLDRFSLFFPEKRPFFLENAGFFTAGTPGEADLFFTRRIGIGADGRPIPILGGARVSGKAGGFNLGVLEMRTRASSNLPANNFALARVFRELKNRSGLGAIAVERRATGDVASGADWGRTFGLDGRWGIGRHLDLTAWAGLTDTPARDRRRRAYSATLNWSSAAWRSYLSHTDVGEGFDPEVGFLRRRDYRKLEGLLLHTARLSSGRWGLLELRPHVSYNGYWKPDGFHESGFVHVDNHFEWRNGWQLHTGVNFIHEGLRAPFEVSPGVVVPAGRYDDVQMQLVGMTNGAAAVSANATVRAGGFFGGTRVSLEPSLRARLGDTLSGQLAWTHNEVSLPGGDFATDLLRLRVSYSFTPRLYLQGLVQYNSRISNWSSNVRFGWQQTANTGLYLVYNENRESETGHPLRDRSLTVKLSRLLDL